VSVERGSEAQRAARLSAINAQRGGGSRASEPLIDMDLPKIIRDLRVELGDVVRAIESLERLAEGDRRRQMGVTASREAGAVAQRAFGAGILPLRGGSLAAAEQDSRRHNTKLTEDHKEPAYGECLDGG